MAQVSQDEVNTRVRDPQLRDILKNYFDNEEIAVRGAQAMENRMDEIIEDFKSEIRAGFAKTANQQSVDNLASIMREYMNKVGELEKQNQRPGHN